VLPFLQPIADALTRLEPNPARMTADFHMAFNVALAVVLQPKYLAFSGR
jgi:phosphate:Na+ symporter